MGFVDRLLFIRGRQSPNARPESSGKEGVQLEHSVERLTRWNRRMLLRAIVPKLLESLRDRYVDARADAAAVLRSVSSVPSMTAIGSPVPASIRK